MVVIIEDEQHLLELLTAEMQLLGYETSCCEHIDDAASQLADPRTKLIIADLGAADGGIPLLASLSNKQTIPPVIFISGNLNWDLRNLFARGAAGFFVKPFARKVFLDRLTFALAAPNQRWAVKAASSPQPDSLPELRVLEINRITWGRYGFVVRHDQNSVFPVNHTTKVTIDSDDPIELIAEPMWYDAQESGWLIESVISGGDTVLRQTSSVCPSISIPYTGLV